MNDMQEPEADSGWPDWIPWRIRVALGSALGALVAIGLIAYFRGTRPSADSVFFSLMFAAGMSLFALRGVRKAPWIVGKRLSRLFRESTNPDLVAITGVLSDAGESPEFERHRQLVDRFMRGMITEHKFYSEMRALAT